MQLSDNYSNQLRTYLRIGSSLVKIKFWFKFSKFFYEAAFTWPRVRIKNWEDEERRSEAALVNIFSFFFQKSCIEHFFRKNRKDLFLAIFSRIRKYISFNFRPTAPLLSWPRWASQSVRKNTKFQTKSFEVQYIVCNQ